MSKSVGEGALGKRRRDEGNDPALADDGAASGNQSKRRVASGSLSSSVSPESIAPSKAPLDPESIAKLAQVLTVRLSYASLKVSQGWTSQTISEVENLYHSRFKAQAEERSRQRALKAHEDAKNNKLRDSGYSANSSALAIGDAALDEYDIEGEEDEDAEGESSLGGYTTEQLLADRSGSMPAQQEMPYRPFGPEAHLAEPYTTTTTIAFQTPSSSPSREYPDAQHGYLSPPPRPASSLQPHPSPSMYNYVNASPVMGHTPRGDASTAGRFAGPPPRLGGVDEEEHAADEAEADKATGLLPAAGIGGSTVRTPQSSNQVNRDIESGSVPTGVQASPTTIGIKQGQAFLLNPRHQESLHRKNPSNPLRGEYSVSNVTMDDLDGTFGTVQ